MVNERETNRIICYRLFLPGTVAVQVQPRTKSEGGCSNGLMGARALRRFGPSRQTDDTLHVQRSLFGLLLSFRRSSSPSSIASCLQLQPVTCSTAVRYAVRKKDEGALAGLDLNAALLSTSCVAPANLARPEMSWHRRGRAHAMQGCTGDAASAAHATCC